jgi:hypothetical protein
MEITGCQLAILETLGDGAFTAMSATSLRLIIEGEFSLGIDTTGYSITAKAVNGTFDLNEIEIGGLSIAKLRSRASEEINKIQKAPPIQGR